MVISAADLYRQTAAALAPAPATTITEWAEQHRVLGASSRLAGLYRVAHSPFWREPMDALGPDSGIQTVVIMKAAQIGCSEILMNVAGYYIDVVPSTVLIGQPTLLMGQRFAKHRLQEMLELSPRLAELTQPTLKGSRRVNTAMHRSASNGAALLISSGNSPTNLRSLPARLILLDEVDSYPASAGREGDPVRLAVARAESYGSAKRVLLISTPTEAGNSRIESAWLQTDQRHWLIHCPHCASRIELQFEQLDRTDGVAVYRCQICSEIIDERDKARLVSEGEWVPSAAAVNPAVRGYHVSQMVSLWTSWDDLLQDYETSRGTPELERAFTNTRLGRTYSQPALDVPESAALMLRREPYPEGIVPAGGALLTLGVDCQPDRLEAELVAWGRQYESWSVAYFVIHGDITGPGPWDQLDALILRDWPSASGLPHRIQATAIDAGYATGEVTGYSRSRHAWRVFATKGLTNSFGKPIWPRRPSQSKTRELVYGIGTDEAKLWVASRLRISQPGAGFMHAPLSRDESWFAGLLAEKLIVDRGKRRWVNPYHRRNEPWDCRVLATAALFSRLLSGVSLEQWATAMEQMTTGPVMPASPPQPTTTRPNGGERPRQPLIRCSVVE